MTTDKHLKSEGFDYRTVLGVWINDLCSVPRLEQWPSIVLDAALERDLVQYFDVMREERLDSIILWGLLASYRWEPGFRESVSAEREQAVRRILDAAHERGIKILYGLGLYSWGFDEIIRVNPDVRGTNPHAMCGSKEASHEMMERLIDYLVGTFAFDGFHFESADQGRCECEQCRAKSDSQYHLELNERTAGYARSKWPEMTIEVFCPIRKGTKSDWLIWQDASQHFTFFIDDHDFTNRFGCDSRKEIISLLQCAYGTMSGTCVYPPQRWDRLRWFIPVIDKRARHYRELVADGGTAVVIVGAPLVNPAEETTLRCSAALAAAPSRSVASVLVEVMERMFRPQTKSVAEELADIFWAAEKAYWCNVNFLTEGGVLYLEPLCGTTAGPPIHLQTRMYDHGLHLYQVALGDIRERFGRIEGELGDRDCGGRVVACLDSVLRDVAKTLKDGSMLKYPASTEGPDRWTDEWLW